ELDDLLSPKASYIRSMATGNLIVAEGMSVQAAVHGADEDGTIDIMPGDYSEGITNVDYLGQPGTGRNFGLMVYKDGLTLRGVDGSGNAITGADYVEAWITALYQAGMGAQHFVSGNGVTVTGLGFKPY